MSIVPPHPHPTDCQCIACEMRRPPRLRHLNLFAGFEPYDFDTLAIALHEAASIAHIIRAHGLLVCTGVVYGAEGRRDLITVAAHTQVLAELRAIEAENITLRARLTACDSDDPVERIIARNTHDRQTEDDEPEFGADLIEAADR
jgi:hypothetical protein